MDECIFCSLAANPSKANAVYEDAVCFVVLDPRPLIKGQVLIVPKKHVMILPQASDEFVAHLGKVVRRVSRSLIVMLKCHGTSTLFNSGVEAGQVAQHFTVAVIPRNEGDGLDFTSSGVELGEQKKSDLNEALRAKVGELFGD